MFDAVFICATNIVLSTWLFEKCIDILADHARKVIDMLTSLVVLCTPTAKLQVDWGENWSSRIFKITKRLRPHTRNFLSRFISLNYAIFPNKLIKSVKKRITFNLKCPF